MTPTDSAAPRTSPRGRSRALGAKRRLQSIDIPPDSLVLLVGPSGSGKSTFATKHFRPTEVLSSDHCRALIGDDENDMTVTREAFDLLHIIAGRRLSRGKLTVIDATNVQPRGRRPLLELAGEFGRPTVAIVFDLPQEVCLERNRRPSGRNIPPRAIGRQVEQMHRSLPGLKREGIELIYILGSAEDADSVEVQRGHA